MKLYFLAVMLAGITPAAAQITPIGGGSSPLFVSGTAQTGTTLQISPLPAPLPAIIVGLSRVDLPLATLGAGCGDTLVPSLDLISPITFSLTIPNDPGLIGFTLYAQGMLVGVAPCLFGFYLQLSNAIEVTIQ